MKLRVCLVWLLWMFSFCYAKEVRMGNWYGVVLAGGVGERLWPLSRKDCPKQFLKLGASSLLDQSIQRLQNVMDQKQICVFTSCAYEKQVSQQVGEKIGSIFIEPSSRNTGPSILCACLDLYEKDPDAKVIFVPADPFIPESDYGKFAESVRRAMTFVASSDGIALLGVKPTYPATGYGYIEYDSDIVQDQLYKVQRFHEKPSLKLASNYIQQQDMLWNIGMFAGRVSVFLDEFKCVAPDLYKEVMDYRQGLISYDEVLSISVDCALIERSDRAWVLPVDFSWCDVGNVDVFLSIKDRLHGLQKNIEQKSTVQVDAHNNIVDVPDKLVALVGVDDLCVVETPDALLITKRTDAEKVRSIVDQLKQANRMDCL